LQKFADCVISLSSRVVNNDVRPCHVGRDVTNWTCRRLTLTTRSRTSVGHDVACREGRYGTSCTPWHHPKQQQIHALKLMSQLRYNWQWTVAVVGIGFELSPQKCRYPTVRHTGPESGDKLCRNFHSKILIVLLSKSVNNVCKLLQLLRSGDSHRVQGLLSPEAARVKW